MFSQGLGTPTWSTIGSPDRSSKMEIPSCSMDDDGSDDGFSSSFPFSLLVGSKILHGSRVFSGLDTSVDIVWLPLNRILVRPPS